MYIFYPPKFSRASLHNIRKIMLISNQNLHNTKSIKNHAQIAELLTVYIQLKILHIKYIGAMISEYTIMRTGQSRKIAK